jgi:type IV pilus biogenesis protein CpaD/CtpE
MRFAHLSFLAVALSLLLGACDTTTPSQIKTGDIRLQREMKTAVLYAVEAEKVDMIADDFRQNGEGRMRGVMGYLAGNPLQEAGVKRQGNAYKQAFASAGVKDLPVEYVGVNDKEKTGYLVVSYAALVARAPSDCMPITGYDGADSRSVVEGYAFGCETKTALSKMISRPADLLGRAGTTDGDARREGTIIERHKSGVPNTRMQGINASTVGSGG